MLVYKTGDMFKEPADAYVNAVNTVGVMGKGLAHQFKTMFPQNFAEYKAKCADGSFKAGRIFVTKSDNAPFIINFATKADWREPSEMSYVRTGLADLREWICEHANEVRSIAIPALGCGNGGLAWMDVKQAIEEELGLYSRVPKDIRLLVYAPTRSSETANADVPKVGLRELVALELGEALPHFDMPSLIAAVQELNRLAGEEVIQSTMFRGVCKNVAAYKKFYGYDNKQASENMYLTIQSKFVDEKLKKLRPLIPKAAQRKEGRPNGET